MVNDETERLLNEIGVLLHEETGSSGTSILLYAQLDTNRVGYSLFIDRNEHVDFSWAGNSVTDHLLSLWEEEEPGKRWAELEYVLRDGKFSVSFIYPGEFDADEGYEAHFERRRRLVARHFGEKPIIYPPLPEGEGETFEL